MRPALGVVVLERDSFGQKELTRTKTEHTKEVLYKLNPYIK